MFKNQKPLQPLPNIEECFFIINQSLSRSISSYSSQCACAIVNRIASEIKDELVDRLDILFNEITTKKQKYSASLFTQPIQFASEMKESNTAVIIILNTIWQVKINIEVLCNNINQELLQNQLINETDKKQFQTAIDQLNDILNQNNIQTKIQISLMEILKSQVQTIIESNLGQASYNLNEVQFQECEVNDPFVNNLIKIFKSNIQQWEVQLHEQVSPVFLENLMELVSNLIYRTFIQQKTPFTALGVMQLDKERDKLVKFFQRKTDKGVRNKFQKVSSMCQILQCEKQEEAIEISQRMFNTWGMSKEEVVKIFKLRVDLGK